MRYIYLVIIGILFMYSSRLFSQDVGITALISPPNGSVLNMLDYYTVKVTVKNYHTDSITGIPIVFEAGNNTPIVHTVTHTLPPNTTWDVTFSTQLAVTSSSKTKGYCFTQLITDTNTSNDTLEFSYSFSNFNSGLSDQDKINMIKLNHITYNPINSQLLLSLTNSGCSDKVEIGLADIFGRSLKNVVANPAVGSKMISINIPNLSKGIYFISVGDDKRQTHKSFLVY